MKKFLIIAGTLLIFLLLISWFILIAYDAVKWKPQPVDTQRLLKVLEEIDRSIEKDDGKIDFNKISSRDDWDKFCLVVAYSSPEREFISDTGPIRKIFPELHDDSFGLGVLFIKNKKIIDHMQCELKIGSQSYIYYKGKKLEKPDYIIPRIGSSATFYGANVIRQFQMMKVKTIVSAEGLLRSRDKLRASQNMVFNDIEVPKTYFPSPNQDNFDYMMDQVGGIPLIVKLLESTQGLGVFLLKDKIKASKFMNQLNIEKSNYLLQEFIEESSGMDVRAFVVGDKVVAAMKRIAAKGEFRSNIHRGGRGEKVELSKEEEEFAIKTAKILNLEVAGVDILRSKRGPLVLEVNSSPGLEGIEKYTEQNIAKEIIEFLENS